MTVALDPGHGAGSLTSPEFFRELGCRVVTVNGQPDGHFPGRDPEPVVDNLEDLGRLVRATDADVGIAHDGDADRAIFFDEDGEYVQGDATLAALAAAELEAGETAVSAVNVSQRLVDVVTDVGAELELTPIGSTNIITRIRELEATGERVPIAGEGNGGIFFPEFRLSRDGAFTAARFLELVAEQPVSEIVSLRRLRERPSERLLQFDRRTRRDARRRREPRQGCRRRTQHSRRLPARLRRRLGARPPSGTEPLVRVYAEARDEDRATELADGMYETLEDAKSRA